MTDGRFGGPEISLLRNRFPATGKRIVSEVWARNDMGEIWALVPLPCARSEGRWPNPKAHGTPSRVGN